jgi:arsenate reductase
MAEGLARHYGKGVVEVESAGLYETGVNPTAIRVMKEIEIDISRQRSKTIEEFKDQPFDYIIHLCTGMDEACPVLPGEKERLSWPFPDPGKVRGSEEEILAAFRRVRDDLKQKVLDFISNICYFS